LTTEQKAFTDFSKAMEIVSEFSKDQPPTLGSCNPAECDLLIKMALRQVNLEKKIKQMEKVI